MATFSSGYSAALGDILSQVNDAFSGKSTGINVSSVVSELMQIQRQPETQMQAEQTTINSQISALTTIGTQLTALQSSVQALEDPVSGALAQMTTGSSDSSVVAASADTTAVAGTHSVTVQQLATVSSSYSAYIPSGSSLAGATITVKYGPDPNNPLSTDTINVPSTDTTLQQAADYINQGSYGVTASVVTDSQGSRLELTSKTSGANGNLTVTSGATTFTDSAGVDAQLTVDGVPIDSATNNVTGAVTGVTFSLGATTDTAVQISVEPDTTGAATALSNFVTAYNAVIGSINSQYTLDSNGKEGVLSGDSMLQSLQSSLLSMISTSVSGVGNYVNLQSMGIEMQNDGTLQINSATLSTALSSDYSDVKAFFQSASPLGWGQMANTEMMHLTDPTLGPVAADINGLTQTNNDLSNQISDFEANMAVVQQQLTTQYGNLDSLLMQYPMQIQAAQAQLGSLMGSNNSSNNG